MIELLIYEILSWRGVGLVSGRHLRYNPPLCGDTLGQPKRLGFEPMINVAAIRMQQFGVQFYQASLTASDIDKLVRFEVLSYGDGAQPGVRGGKRRSGESTGPVSKVNWDLLERRIASSEKAYQRHIIRRKIDELVQYYEQCRQARDLPSIPGAVIISCDEKLTFQASDDDPR